MAGLASIALAVAHLESLKGEDEEEQASAPSAPPTLEGSDARLNNHVSSSNSQSMPYPRLHGRMVSDDSINSKNQDVNMHRSPAVFMDECPVSMVPVYAVHPSSYYQQWYASSSYQPPPPPSVPSSVPKVAPPPPPPPVNEKAPLAASSSGINASSSDETSSPDGEGKVPNTGPAAALLHKISLVTDDLEKFFSLMNAMEQLALPDNAKRAEVPSFDETILQVQVQRHDVLLGRGGETNHHLGNIQYRQLVKASQPAYLAAKRRDKPRIAAAIVAVVRARSGRFLKKHLGDHTWRDVGNVRAREKTSQALREGAPELRGNVEAYRTHLLTEAVDGGNGHPLNTNVDVGGVGAVTSANAATSTMMTESAEDVSQPTHDAMGPSLMVPGMMHHFSRHHYHPHHHPVPIAMVNTSASMYYHPHPHHHSVVYHPAAIAEAGHYHSPHPQQMYSGEKRSQMGAAVTLSSEPPLKRPNPASRDDRGISTGSVVEAAAAVVSAPALSTTTPSTVVAVSSAENSEEEVVVRTLSPASSTSSKLVASRGPRIKLLKQRVEDNTAQDEEAPTAAV